jgi:hypothetical protein
VAVGNRHCRFDRTAFTRLMKSSVQLCKTDANNVTECRAEGVWYGGPPAGRDEGVWYGGPPAGRDGANAGEVLALQLLLAVASECL